MSARWTCETCTAWSQLLAEAVPGGPVRAACLNPRSPLSANNPNPDKWPRGSDRCNEWTDDPTMSDLYQETA